MNAPRIGPGERRALLHTLHTNRVHTDKRIVELRRQIRALNDELERAERQLDDIDQSIDWLQE
jgi:septal ring factor EnvC (AmiA/AmiB activator)